ncbi:MAG: polysaccharide deacetylase family protein [Nitrospirae bacterium]|nr:polysaccharide deacetylase family protein [Nitrospirota bacterium]
MIPVLLRVDIDFSFGLRKGVPYILDVLDEYGVKATFFSVMGPDTASTHTRNFSKKGYLKRIMAMNPLKMLVGFGPLFFLRGKLLPLKYVGSGHPGILKEIADRGHELGLHSYNHAQWAGLWPELPDTYIEEDLKRAGDEYRKIFKKDFHLWGSPNWRTSEHLYRLLVDMGALYTSNVRGNSPFFPKYGDTIYKTTELPITMPALHELVQAGIKKHDTVKVLDKCLTSEYNQWVIHCYYEGILERKMFENALRHLADLGCAFYTFEQFFKQIRTDTLPACEIDAVTVPGGIGSISCQKTFLENNYFRYLKSVL